MTLKPAVQHRKSSFSTADSYRIPMPVREILELPNGYRAAVCPRCKCTLDREYQRFCDRCGQHLLWKFFCSATVISGNILWTEIAARNFSAILKPMTGV